MSTRTLDRKTELLNDLKFIRVAVALAIPYLSTDLNITRDAVVVAIQRHDPVVMAKLGEMVHAAAEAAAQEEAALAANFTPVTVPM